MKKISLIALFTALVMNVNATDIWTGSKHVSWADGGLQIAADQFTNAQPGQKIVLHFTGASDGVEFKVMNEHFDHLAGSRESAWINGDGTFEQFLTQAAVDGLKAHGLEIIGANFTATQVELLDGKAELKEGYTVWTGFFWADEWSTLELYRDGYSNVDFSKVSALRIYSEAGRSDFVINIKEYWEEGGQIADQNAMTAGEGYMELPLTDELRNRLANAGHWMIQFNKEAGSPFNVTDIVLVMESEPEYYLVGSMNGWTINEAYQFAVNPAAEGEYMLTTTLTEGDEIKVTSSKNAWYPDGMDNNYVIDAAHAGDVNVYFRPDGQGGEGWHYGFFYVEVIVKQAVENTAIEGKAVKSFRNGMLVIEKNGKIYNALGTELK
jgi:hypothetical protein